MDLIIIPTYNEVKNVEKLAGDIFKTKTDARILFVDDNSPDGTGGILEKIKKETGKIDILHRDKKMGLGSAYRDGFRWARGKGKG